MSGVTFLAIATKVVMSRIRTRVFITTVSGPPRLITSPPSRRPWPQLRIGTREGRESADRSGHIGRMAHFITAGPYRSRRHTRSADNDQDSSALWLRS